MFSVTYVSVEEIDLKSGRQFGQSGSELPVFSAVVFVATDQLESNHKLCKSCTL
jgi:hypothetical protein